MLQYFSKFWTSIYILLKIWEQRNGLLSLVQMFLTMKIWVFWYTLHSNFHPDKSLMQFQGSTKVSIRMIFHKCLHICSYKDAPKLKVNLNAVVWWRKSVMWCIDVEYIDYKAAAVYPIVCPSSVIIIILHDICFIMFHLYGKSYNSHLQILVVYIEVLSMINNYCF